MTSAQPSTPPFTHPTLNNMTTMKNPTPLLELCEKATKGPWTSTSSRGLVYTKTGKIVCAMPHGIRRNGLLNQKKGVTDIETPDAQLIARLSPEVVKAVYEALEWAEKELVSFNGSPCEKALALLDGLTQVTFTTPPDSRTGFKSRSVV